MSRLQQRLAHLEQSLHPEGRLCAVIDDGSEDIEARIARCGAETGLSARDLVVIVKRFCGKTREPHWTMRPLVAVAEKPDPTQRNPVARKKDLQCFSLSVTTLSAWRPRSCQRGAYLCSTEMSRPRPNPDLPRYAEQLAVFKANNGVGPHDTLVTVIFK